MPRPIGGSRPRDGRAVGDSFYLPSFGGLPDVLSLPCPAYVLPVEDMFGGVGVGWAALAPAGGGGGGAGWAVLATPVDDADRHRRAPRSQRQVHLTRARGGRGAHYDASSAAARCFPPSV
jgi:hypothetical protein